MASFGHFALVIPKNLSLNKHALLRISICINEFAWVFSKLYFRVGSQHYKIQIFGTPEDRIIILPTY